MDNVENFIRNKIEQLSKWDKFFNIIPTFYLAKDFGVSPPPGYLQPSFVIKPSILPRLLALPFLVASSFFGIILLSLVLRNILLPITLSFLFLVVCLIVFIVRTIFINPKYSYRIVIDENMMVAHVNTFKWESILEVMVMVKGAGRSQELFLVIFTRNNDIYQYSLRNFRISVHQLLEKIQTYREIARTQQMEH